MVGVGLGRLVAHPSLAAARAMVKRGLASGSERVLGRQSLHGRFGADGFYSLCIPGLAGPFVLSRGPLAVSGFVADLARGEPVPWRVRVGRRVVEAAPCERQDVAVALGRIAALPLLCGGAASVRLRRGVGLLRVEARTGPGAWSPIFRALLIGLDTRIAGFDEGDDCARYPDWRAREMRIAEGDAAGQRDHAALVAGRPSVTAIVVGPPGGDLADTVASLRAQTFPAHETLLVGPDGDAPDPARARTFADALSRAGGDYVLPLRAGDRLRPDALYALATAARRSPGLDLVYADEESGTGGRDPLPFFKPAWSPDTLESYDYVGAPAFYRATVARGLPACDAYDLALRFTEAPRRIAHLPQVLCRRPGSAIDPVHADATGRALAGRLARTGRPGLAVPVEPGFAPHRLDVAVPEPAPLVSIVIPTAGRDLAVGERRLDLVVDCVRGIRERSSYRAVEIVVVANPDLPPAKERALSGLGCRIARYGDPAVNIARKLNVGAALATGAFLILLNDDVEIITPDWIERLLAQAAKPHVGVVGAKLLYPDDTLQHVGVVTLHANPNHVRRGYPGADRGYALGSVAPRNYGAVTGACMMTRTETYRAVGGYDEAYPVHFNDVDYCFKVRAQGLSVVFEPECRLYHFESASRTADAHPEELARFQARWTGWLDDDPFYPNHAFATRPPAFETFMRAAPQVP